MGQPAVLIAEEDGALRDQIREVVAENGGVYEARDASEALGHLETKPIDLVILGHVLDCGSEILKLAREIRRRHGQISIICIAKRSSEELAIEAFRLGVADYLKVPFVPAELLRAICRSLSGPRRATAPLSPEHEAVSDLEEIMGASPAMRDVKERIRAVAPTEATVLITGETGTGKDLVAHAIHRLGKRSTKRLVSHNCAATPPDLFESHFFGHNRGAFTGANEDHPGLLAQADGSDLFLDELEALSLFHQAKLLRVLEDGEVRPLGSVEARRVSIRFLVAMNRDPRDMVSEGSLRGDLYQRLKQVEIRLPPLRDRPGDLPLLTAHFLEKEVISMEPRALMTLEAHSWPGNVRELRNLLLAARIWAEARGRNTITLEDLRVCEPTLFGGSQPSRGGLDRRLKTLKEVESEAILDALRKAQGNRSNAAQMLGIDRTTLRRKLRKLASESAEVWDLERGEN